MSLTKPLPVGDSGSSTKERERGTKRLFDSSKMRSLLQLMRRRSDSPASGTPGIELTAYPCAVPQQRLRQTSTFSPCHFEIGDDELLDRGNDRARGQTRRIRRGNSIQLRDNNRLATLRSGDISTQGKSHCRITSDSIKLASRGLRTPKTPDCSILWRQYWD